MDTVYIGYVQGVHGLRGDLKIKSSFERPELVFKAGQEILLNDESHTITGCKFYKGIYLVTIDNIKNINAVEHYKGYDVFIEREKLNLESNEYLLKDLYGLKIECDGKTYGVVSEILNNGMYDILVVDYEKKYMIPNISEYVERVDLANGKIICRDIEGLIL